MNDNPPGPATDRFAWFPGQGVQRRGMGMRLLAKDPYVADLFKQASEALGFDLPALITDSTEEKLARTENAQPAIVASSAASYLAWARQSDKEDLPQWFAGHSIGALSAAIACGLLPFGQGVRLARRRGELMGSTPGQGGMLAVSVTTPEARERALEIASAHRLEVAAFNGPRQIVLSGPEDGLRQAVDTIGRCGTRLNVSHAFHSRMMQPAQEAWDQEIAATALDESVFAAGARPYLGCCSAIFAEDCEGVREDLRMALTKPVRWDAVIQEASHCTSGYIFGDGRILARMWRDRPRHLRIAVINDGHEEVL